jgi:hypothetical protein
MFATPLFLYAARQYRIAFADASAAAKILCAFAR